MTEATAAQTLSPKVEPPSPVPATPPDASTAANTAAAASPAPGSPPLLTAGGFVRKHKWPVLAGLAGLGLLLAAGLAMVRGTAVDVVLVRRADLVETVVASGHVESQFRVDIASQMTGTVAQIPVAEGQTVHAGQILLVLVSDELVGSAAQARGVLAQAQAHMRQMRELSLPGALEAQRAAAASLLGTQQIYNRTATLMRQGFVTRAQFDEAQKNRDMARAQLETASTQVRGAATGGSDYASAESVLGQASAGYAAANSRLAYTRIVAPRDGVLISRSAEQGSVVTPGQVLMVLAPSGGVQLVLQIDERNLGKVAVGQAALAAADAYPDRRFAARVAFINPGIDLARASATMKLAVTKPPAYLRQDMTVSVDIETARRTAALVLPVGAVHDMLSASPWVLLVRDGRAVRRNVRLGLIGNLQVQILSGLAVGDAVIPTTAAITPGDRVRPRSR